MSARACASNAALRSWCSACALSKRVKKLHSLCRRQQPGTECSNLTFEHLVQMFDLETFYRQSAFRIILILATTICGLYAYFDLYSGIRLTRRRFESLHITQSVFIALLLFFGYFYISANRYHPRSYFATCSVFIIFYTSYCIIVRIPIGPHYSYLTHVG